MRTPSGAHDRNRTDDLLLTMEMLYRLSYVGCDDRDVQAGSTCSEHAAVMEYCTGSMTRRGSASWGAKDALTPRRLPLRESRRGCVRARESRCNGARGVNPKIEKSRISLAPGPGSSRDRVVQPGLGSRPRARSAERIWSGKRDSNPRPSAWKADALPLSYSRSSHCCGKRDGGGGRIRTFEGIADRFTVCSLWPLGNPSTSTMRSPRSGGPVMRDEAELAKGLEPPTTSLQMRCSTN